MQAFRFLLVGFLIALPLSASAALGVPFGGRTVAPYYPACLNGGVYQTVFGVKGGGFVWMPGSLTYANYQIRPGVNQLGIADVLYPCVISIKPPIVWWGLRIQMVGTSLTI